ncbi:MAG: hypothetical protein R3C53_28445 [Pirellulaceae bacterium]
MLDCKKVDIDDAEDMQSYVIFSMNRGVMVSKQSSLVPKIGIPGQHHRFAVKEEPSKLSSIGQKPVPTEINHNFNFSAAKLNSQSRCGVAPERRTARADFR